MKMGSIVLKVPVMLGGTRGGGEGGAVLINFAFPILTPPPPGLTRRGNGLYSFKL